MTAPPVIEDRPHARVNPSGYERISRCTKSLVLSAQAPRRLAGPDAAAGTAGHAIFERCLREDLDTFEVPRGAARVDGHEVKIDEGMLEGVQVALDWCRANLDPPLIVERRVELAEASEVLGEPVYGYIDAASLRPVPTVVDLKMGFNPVAADAPQLKLYLVGLLGEVGPIPSTGEVVGRTVVVQPRSAGETVRVAEHTGAELRAFAREVLAVMRRVARRDWTYGAGEWCRWCPAAGFCPHLAAVARDAALARITPSPEMVASGEFSAERLEEALGLVSSLDAWCRAVTATAEDYLIHGGKLRGWKLVRKKTNRRWARPEAEVAGALRALGVEDPHEHVLLSPAKAEKALPPGKRREVDGLAEKPAGDLTLARADDRRPGVEVAATLQRALEGAVAAGFLAPSREDRARLEPHSREANGET